MWKRASQAFEGGTDAARALIGRKVRSRSAAQHFGYNGLTQGLTSPVTLAAGAEGFVSGAVRTSLILAFPKSGPLPASPAALARNGNFTTLSVEWREFRVGFEIEA